MSVSGFEPVIPRDLLLFFAGISDGWRIKKIRRKGNLHRKVITMYTLRTNSHEETDQRIVKEMLDGERK